MTGARGQAWATGSAYPLDFCHLCEGPVNRVPPRAVGTHTDPFGFTYRLCAGHYRALLTGFARAECFRPTEARPRRPDLPRPAGRSPHPRRRQDDPTATGAEQREARQRRRWSLRRLAAETGYSFSQLQGAESGRRPVSAPVARWVRQVLDETTPGRILAADKQ